MLYKHNDDEGFTPLIEGISIKTLVYGEKMLTAKFLLRKEAILPIHKHPHEQTGFLISGKIEFTIDNKTWVAESGDSWSIAGNIEHGASVLEDSEIIEVFTPVRADYLPQNLARKK